MKKLTNTMLHIAGGAVAFWALGQGLGLLMNMPAESALVYVLFGMWLGCRRRR